jgi:hypothetical protein
MTALIGIVAAAAAFVTPLPPLPAQGLVLSQGNGITFVDLRGRKLGHVDGLRLATEYALSSGVPRFRDGDGRLWSLDVRGHRLVPAVGGLPLSGDATLLFAPRPRAWLVLRHGRIALRMPVGHEFPFLSEDRDVVSTGRRARSTSAGGGSSVCRVAASRRDAPYLNHERWAGRRPDSRSSASRAESAAAPTTVGRASTASTPTARQD